jgi:hypothetical protein
VSPGKWNIIIDDMFEPGFEASPRMDRDAEEVLDGEYANADLASGANIGLW